MKEYLYYLFDADGTLIDTRELIYRSYCHTLALFHGPSVSREEIYRGIGIPLRTQFNKYLGEKSEEEYTQIYNAYSTYQFGLAPALLRLFPGVKSVLELLKERGKKCVVVTSRTLPTLVTYFKTLDIHDYFESFITPELTEKHKPDPEPVLKALEFFHANPEQALFIGDTNVDMMSAGRAHVHTCFVTWGNGKIEQLKEKPTYIVYRMEDLILI